ncbi:MAG: hypothetical protein R2795_17245 [Saprospiraceae bacterium]
MYWIADFRDLAVHPVRRDAWFPLLAGFQRRLLRSFQLSYYRFQRI